MAERSGGFFFVQNENSRLPIGGACPPPNASRLVSDEPFEGLSLFILEGTEDQIVYLCSSGFVVGLCEFDYVPLTSQPTFPVSDVPSFVPTMSPAPTSMVSAGSVLPTIIGSSLPSCTSEACASECVQVIGKSLPNLGDVSSIFLFSLNLTFALDDKALPLLMRIKV